MPAGRTLLAEVQPQTDGHLPTIMPENTDKLPPPARRRSRGARVWLRSVPFVTLLGYYVLLVAVVGILSSLFPVVRDAFFTPVDVEVTSRSDAAALLQGQVGPMVST